MKRIIAFLLSAVICLGFAACNDTSDINVPMGMMLASNPDVPDYVLMVPNDWTIESTTGTTTAYYRDNLSNAVLATFSATFNVPSSADVTLENYFDSYLKEYSDVFGEPESIEENDGLLGGEPSKEYVYSAAFGGAEYKFWQVVCFHDGRIYTLTYSATEEYFDKFAEDMSLILTNFYFKK